MDITTTNHTESWEGDYDHRIEQGNYPTIRFAYTRDVAFFWDWPDAQLGQFPAYPTAIETVLQFCLLHLDPNLPSPLKLAILRRYMATLSLAHHDIGVPSPAQDKRIGYLLKRIKSAKPEHSYHKTTSTPEILKPLMVTAPRYWMIQLYRLCSLNVQVTATNDDFFEDLGEAIATMP